jgi:phage terminase large subunit GpA-like protein
MGIFVIHRMQCGCKKSLEMNSPMKRIAIKKSSDTNFEMIYQCRHCNRSIKVELKMCYIDYKKGVDIE